MPVIRCPQCSQPYDIPPSIAVKLPSSIARCHCGEWLCGNREALINRVLGDGQLEEIDLQQYRIEEMDAPVAEEIPTDEEPFDVGGPRSVRIIAHGADEKVDAVFAIDRHPLLIGRRGCHIELDDAELSIRHCEIVRRGGDLLLRDSGSHTGTYLDGEPVDESVLGEGMHLVRVGSALVCIEPTDQPGFPVEPIEIDTQDLLGASPLLMKRLLEKGAKSLDQGGASHFFLVCVEGPCTGEEYEIPMDGGIVGREGTVRVPDEYLSRKHFAFFRDPDDGTLRIRDLGSRNGTFLNTLPAKNTRVHHGDEIKAGFSRFRVEERRG